MQKQIFEFMGRRIELWTHPDPDHMGRMIRGNRSFYELDLLMKCRELYLPGTAVVDVGANIGNHTVFFGAILNAPVYAFEPYPPNHDLLQMNIAANGLEGQVHPTRCALGETDGFGSLRPGPPTNLGTTSVSFGTGDTPVRTLDSLSIPTAISLLKIDVEGTETAVLGGAARTIRRWLPDIVVEAGDPKSFAAVARQLLEFAYTPRGRYAATPTYLFSATDQDRRVRSLLAGA